MHQHVDSQRQSTSTCVSFKAPGTSYHLLSFLVNTAENEEISHCPQTFAERTHKHLMTSRRRPNSFEALSPGPSVSALPHNTTLVCASYSVAFARAIHSRLSVYLAAVGVHSVLVVLFHISSTLASSLRAFAVV